MITVVCWNINRSRETWNELFAMGADLALLQEVGKVPAAMPPGCEIGGNSHWASSPGDRWPAIVKLSDRVDVEWFDPVPVASVNQKWNLDNAEVPISDARTIAIARVTPRGSEPFIAVSMYARWLGYHPLTRGASTHISDNSMHRIISDFSIFIRHADPQNHRILLAGDMNAFYGEQFEEGDGKPYREVSAFERLASLGLEFLGPQFPDGQPSRPDVVDASIGPGTKNVPTLRTNKNDPESAKNQLDYVFASCGFHKSIRTRALNEADEWGASDHCRILIEVGE